MEEAVILILRYRKASIYSSIKAGTKSSAEPQLCCIQGPDTTARAIPSSRSRTSSLLSNISFLYTVVYYETLYIHIFVASISLRLENENFTGLLATMPGLLSTSLRERPSRSEPIGNSENRDDRSLSIHINESIYQFPPSTKESAYVRRSKIHR